jgi:hypothetical protein
VIEDPDDHPEEQAIDDDQTHNDPQMDPDGVLTDIYATDLGGALGGPDGDVPLLTGFDPVDPQIVPISIEEFIGNSGTIYPSDLETVTLGDLGALLPGYDLSQFVGDPNSIVYVAQATVPLSDITTTVSEPTTLGVLLVGFSGLLALGLKNTRGQKVIEC